MNTVVVDAFYFFNELDILEIRLNVLDPFVDRFIIVEATETFTGIPKPLLFEQRREQFQRFNNKVTYLVTNDTPKNAEDLRKRLHQHDLSDLDREIAIRALTSDNVPVGEVQWLKEFYQKECVKRALVGLRDTDFVYISDVDEIWNPMVPIDYSQPDLYKYKQDAYYYFLNNRTNDNWITGWTGTVATQYGNIRRGCVNHLRTHSKNSYTVVEKGGWHFTFQGGADRIRKKLAAYGHTEFNTRPITEDLENAIADNRDYRGRRLKFWLDESRLPRYLLEHRDRYPALFRTK